MSAMDAGADAAHILRPGLQLWLDQYRPAIARAQILQCGIERREALLIAGSSVTHDIAVGDRVIGELTPQLHIDHRAVEPEAPRAFHPGVDIEYEIHTVPQRVTD